MIVESLHFMAHSINKRQQNGERLPKQSSWCGSSHGNHRCSGKDKLRGKGYSSIEDLLACKAFIAALEDPLKGTSRKGKAFQLTMHNAYKLLLKEQTKFDKQQWSSATTSARALMVEPTIYDERTPDSLYMRYKDQIALCVNK